MEKGALGLRTMRTQDFEPHQFEIRLPVLALPTFGAKADAKVALKLV